MSSGISHRSPGRSPGGLYTSELWSLPLYARTTPASGSNVGRIGALALALGIGASIVTGLGAAVARADAGNTGPSSSAPADIAASHSARASTTPGTGSSTRITSTSIKTSPTSTTTPTTLEVDSARDAAWPPPGAAGRRTPADLPAAASAVAPHSSSGTTPPSHPTITTSPPAGHLVLPSVRNVLPSVFDSPTALPVRSAAATEFPVAPPLAASGTSVAPQLGTAPTAAPATASVSETGQQPTTVAPAPAAGASITAEVAKVVAALTGAMSGGTPTVPADTSLALMVGTARRTGNTATMRMPAGAASRTAAAATTPTTTTIKAATMTLSPSTAGGVVADRTASAGYALALTANGAASTTVTLPASTGLTIRAKASSGSPNMTLSIDGVPVTTVVVNGSSWASYTILGSIAAGPHVLTISSSNATSQSALYLDKLVTTTGPFVENFSGNSGAAPSSATWNVTTGAGWDPGIETYSTSNVALDGQGHLVIRATKTPSGYASGRMDTENKVSFGYGTITARIQVPKGQGLWPAFWLQGADASTIPWPQSGEIDVFELPSTTTTVYSTLHGPIAGSTDTQQAQIIANMPDLSTGYHNFWVTHLPNAITFGVDGQTLGTLTPASLSPGSMWVYNQPMFVILNLAVGGPWAGAPNSSTPFPAQMTVDSLQWTPA